jgi:Tfp pilus assembly protein PilN
MRAVNLIPSEQRQGAGSLTGRSGGAALIVLALIAGLAVLAFVYGTSERNVSSRRGELARANAQLSAARTQAGQLASYTSFIATANQRAQQVSQLVASRFDWSHAFHELGRVLPKDASLTTLHGTVGAGAGTGASTSTPTATATAGATPTSATPPGSTPVFALSGCATSQSVVALTLQRLRLMDGASEVTLQSSAKAAGGGSSGASSSSSGSAGCSPNDPAFSAQVTFAALPAAPSAGAPTGQGTAVQTSAQSGGAPR